MTKPFIAILSLILSCSFTYGQTPNIDLNILGKKVSYFTNLEKSLGSSKYKTDQTYISDNNTAQPLVFIRKETGLPDLLVYYTFSKKDSIISEILYEWDVTNFDKKDNNQQTLDFEKKLIERYNQIVELVSSKYGQSVVTGNLNDLSLINSRAGLRRMDIWKPNDSFKIRSYATISNFYKQDNFTTVNPTHRIRLYVELAKN